MRDSSKSQVHHALLPALLAVLVLLVASCSKPAAPPNFLLISIDTLRADHLGCYGYERATSPNLDRLANGALRFENAFVPAPWTLPSHVAMLTGRHPHELGIADLRSKIPESTPLLAELLRDSGYQTAAFVDSPPGGFVGGKRGFERGFESYSHGPHEGAPHGNESPLQFDMDSTVRAGLRWLDGRDRSRPFFLFLHTKAVHTVPFGPGMEILADEPYLKPEPYQSRFLPKDRTQFNWRNEEGKAGVFYLIGLNEKILAGSLRAEDFSPQQAQELIGIYDAGIYSVDEQVGHLIAGLEQMGLDRNTVVIVTADHGEGFRDHEYFLHFELMPTLLRVPLILHDPDLNAGAVISETVEIMDIVPTVLARAGLPIPEHLAGRPLPQSVSGGEEQERSLFSYHRFDENSVLEGFAVAEGPWRLLYYKYRGDEEYRSFLYHGDRLLADEKPIEGQGDRKRTMLAKLLRWIESGGGSDPGQHIQLDDRALEQLRALGYIEIER